MEVGPGEVVPPASRGRWLSLIEGDVGCLPGTICLFPCVGRLGLGKCEGSGDPKASKDKIRLSWSYGLTVEPIWLKKSG